MDYFAKYINIPHSIPWKEINDKVKSDIDRKIIRDAYYWVSLCYKQYKNQKEK